YKEPGYSSQVWEDGVRLFVDKRRLPGGEGDRRARLGQAGGQAARAGADSHRPLPGPNRGRASRGGRALGGFGPALLPPPRDVVAERLVRPAKLRSVVDGQGGRAALFGTDAAFGPGAIPPRQRSHRRPAKDQRLF